MQVDCQILANGDTLSLKGRGQSHVTRSFKFCPIISVELVKLYTSNLVYWLIQRSTSASMIYYIKRDVFWVTWLLWSFGN